MNAPAPVTSDPKAIAADIARKLRENPDSWIKGAYTNDCGSKRCLAAHLWDYFEGAVPSDVYGVFTTACGFEMLSTWNDRPERTVEDVIALCDKVAQS